MEIILLENLKNLGTIGDIVNVAPGYARNYLLPRKKALRATKTNKLLFENKRHVIEQEIASKKNAAVDAVNTINGKSFAVIRQAGDDGRLYGSVTSKDIISILKLELNINISPENVLLCDKIKTIGTFEVILELFHDVRCIIYLVVARSNEEASVEIDKIINKPNSQITENL